MAIPSNKLWMRSTVIAAFVAASLVLPVNQARAFDPDKVFADNDEPQTILRYGYNALKDGRSEDAVGAFRHGALKNNLPSQWKLGRMLQLGQGVPQNHLAAYGLFEKIAYRYAEIPPNRLDLPYVASAVRILGFYHLSGIEGSRVIPDPQAAEFHFYRAGALYGDAEAQFQLGRLYNSEQLGHRRPRTAARWYELASRKGHARAQAELGEMLFNGDGVRKNRVRALVYLSKAAAGSARGGLSAINRKRKKAFSRASAAQRRAAQKIIARLKIKPRNHGLTPREEIRTFGLTANSAAGAVSVKQAD